MTPTAAFRRFVAERERIRLRREAGERPPWTRDPVLQRYRFTNVSRQFDRTTRYLRTFLDDEARVDQLKTIITFRLFNRITTWEAVEWQRWDWPRMAANLEAASRLGPTCSGVWITGGSAQPGVPMWKAQIRAAESACGRVPWLLEQGSMAEMHAALSLLDRIGPFVANEMLMDVAYATDVLGGAPDRETFVHLGPGAVRMLRALQLRHVGVGSSHAPLKLRADVEDREAFWRLVAQVRLRPPCGYRLTVHDVEHCLCEADKYMRALGGQTLKNKFTPKEN